MPELPVYVSSRKNTEINSQMENKEKNKQLKTGGQQITTRHIPVFLLSTVFVLLLLLLPPLDQIRCPKCSLVLLMFHLNVVIKNLFVFRTVFGQSLR